MSNKLEAVRLIDIDDTLVDRGPVLRAWGLGMSKIKSHGIPRSYGAPRNHEPVDIPIKNPFEMLYLRAHSRRGLLPGAKDGLETAAETGKNVVNSGRSNKKAWDEMTRISFRRPGIGGLFQEFNYKPSGMTSTESKIDVALQYEKKGYEIEFYDDDPRTAIDEAQLFPNSKVFYIERGITDRMVSPRILRQYPNLHIVPSFKEAILSYNK